MVEVLISFMFTFWRWFWEGSFYFCLGYIFKSHKESPWVLLTMPPTHYGASHRDVPRGKITSELHSIYSMLMVNSLILFLGFQFWNNYSPRDRKEYWSFLNMTDQTTITLWYRFLQKSERGRRWLTDWSDWASDCPSSPVRVKVECSRLRDLFGCQVTGCSATRILSSSITGCHPRPTGSFNWRGGYSSAEVQSAYSRASAYRAEWRCSLAQYPGYDNRYNR